MYALLKNGEVKEINLFFYLFLVRNILCEHTERAQGTPNVFLTHAIVFVSLGNVELTPILTYLQHIFLACTLSLQRAWRAHRACRGC